LDHGNHAPDHPFLSRLPSLPPPDAVGIAVGAAAVLLLLVVVLLLLLLVVLLVLLLVFA
jgi:hypothetical protein